MDRSAHWRSSITSSTGRSSASSVIVWCSRSSSRTGGPSPRAEGSRSSHFGSSAPMSSSGRDRTALRIADSTGQNGGASAMSMAFPVSTTASSRRACRTSSLTSLVLPTPASPPTSTAPAWPTQAAGKHPSAWTAHASVPVSPPLGVSGYRGSLPPTSRCRVRVRPPTCRPSSPGGRCAAAVSTCCRWSASPAATSPGWGLKEYEKHGTVSGVALPPGLVEGSRLPEPIFTPTTKAPVGEHDEFLTFADVEALVGAATAERLRTLTLEVYRRGAELAEANGHPRRRHEAGVRPRPAGRDRARRRGAHPGLVAVLARRPLGPRRPAVLLRQAVRARLVRGPRLGPHPAGPGDPAGRRRRHARPLHGGLRDAHRAFISPWRNRRCALRIALGRRRPGGASPPRSTPAACR